MGLIQGCLQNRLRVFNGLDRNALGYRYTIPPMVLKFQHLFGILQIASFGGGHIVGAEPRCLFFILMGGSRSRRSAATFVWSSNRI